MIDRILAAVITAREEFQADRCVATGMAWAYKVGKLSVHYRSYDREYLDVEVRESIERELEAHMNWER